jgi:hypothetical protein
MKVSYLVVSALASFSLAAPVVESDNGGIKFNVSAPNSASGHISGPDVAKLTAALEDVLQDVTSIGMWFSCFGGLNMSVLPAHLSYVKQRRRSSRSQPILWPR